MYNRIAEKIAFYLAPMLIKHLDEQSSEIHICTERLDAALNKIDIMIARSDARVQSVNHMVDNCLELSRTMAKTMDQSSGIVHENSVALTKAIEAHSATEAIYADSIRALQTRCDTLQGALTKEQENSANLRHAISDIKNTLDHFVSSSLRPNVNINPK